MEDFFKQPILNSPYAHPARHWELDESGQPTNRIIENRRRAEFITPIPKPKKRKKAAEQQELVFDEGKGLSTDKLQYETMSRLNEVRQRVDTWRKIPNPNEWRVTPETARLLKHWRTHTFSNLRPFFCQVEAVETAIWLSEVAPYSAEGKRILEYLDAANEQANPGLLRLSLKLATGAGKTTVMATLGSDPSAAAGPYGTGEIPCFPRDFACLHAAGGPQALNPISRPLNYHGRRSGRRVRFPA
ncbi:MAG: hypothetical protein IPK83_02770 [Planctomycetes bacterium]|nr:hypothetical protein [Planctomycetota bacterium]